MSTSQLVQFSGRRIHDAVTWIAGACDSLPGMTTIDPIEGLSRRGMLTRSAAGLGIALSGSVSGLFGTAASPAVAKPTPSGAGYGPLVDDPAGKLSLPEGFEYKLVAESGVTQLESGEPTPSDPDGTAAFVRHGGSGSVLVMQPREQRQRAVSRPASGGLRLRLDPRATGGTTNLEVDRHGKRVRQYVSLAGTSTNCTGSGTPLGHLADLRGDARRSLEAARLRVRGRPFRPAANRNPETDQGTGRCRARGLRRSRIRIEAGIYLTEDAGNPNGLLYRWTPPRKALPPTAPASSGGLADDAGATRGDDRPLHPARAEHVPGPLAESKRPRARTYRIRSVDVPDRDTTSPVDPQAERRRPDHTQPQVRGHVVG